MIIFGYAGTLAAVWTHLSWRPDHDNVRQVEILNHYGSHYYCTVSNVRVYGASEYEVLDHQDSEPHETETSDYEELIGEFAPDVPEPRAPDDGAGGGACLFCPLKSKAAFCHSLEAKDVPIGEAPAVVMVKGCSGLLILVSVSCVLFSSSSLSRH